MVIPLSHIKPGESARVVFLANQMNMAGRLRDLGFESGAIISCIMQRPKKNIAAYLVRNAVIALREDDSRFIFVREIPVPDISGDQILPEACAAFGCIDVTSETEVSS